MTESPITLRIEIESSDEFHDRFIEDIQRLEGGEDVGETRLLSLPDEAALARLFRETNLQLLRTIAEHRPTSMRETAQLVDRDIKDVSRNLNELAELGVIEFEQDGRSKRPTIPFDEIEVTVPIRHLNGDERIAPV